MQPKIEECQFSNKVEKAPRKPSVESQREWLNNAGDVLPFYGGPPTGTESC